MFNFSFLSFYFLFLFSTKQLLLLLNANLFFFYFINSRHHRFIVDRILSHHTIHLYPSMYRIENHTV